MSTSWHDFLFASLDPSGADDGRQATAGAVGPGAVGAGLRLPLAEHARAAGADGRRRVGARLRPRRAGASGAPAGFVAGLALALTPIAVAISRHNNPDALLVLCCVAALWFAVRGARGRPHALAGARAASASGSASRPRWRVALLVVPGIARPGCGCAARARCRRCASCWPAARRWSVVGLAPGRCWSTLTPAADRPWISGTERQQHLVADLRLQRPRPARRPDRRPGRRRRRRWWRRLFGGATGPLRLLNSALGGQAGWLLGVAVVAGLGLLVATRLRRARPPHRLADRRRRRLPHHGRRVQLRLGDLPPLLRLAAGAVRRRLIGAGRGRAPAAAGRADRVPLAIAPGRSPSSSCWATSRAT